MEDERKSRKQLLRELAQLRRKVAELAPELGQITCDPFDMQAAIAKVVQTVTPWPRRRVWRWRKRSSRAGEEGCGWSQVWERGARSISRCPREKVNWGAQDESSK